MQQDLRKEKRVVSVKTYSMSWEDAGGLTRAEQLQGLDQSPSGIGAKCPVELQPGTRVYVEGQDGTPAGYCVVRHCNRRGTSYVIGFELEEATKRTVLPDDLPEFYEFLQISPKAEFATIQRVYRFLASRYHPDNKETGDPHKFLLLNQAYRVLSDPIRRSAYDQKIEKKKPGPAPEMQSLDFMDGIEGELNRRLAVLSLLYNRRRSNSDHPQVSLAELEEEMGFPREYLDFTTWYLKAKQYITRADNSDFTLTAVGVDFVEENYTRMPVLQKLLLNKGTPMGNGAGRSNGFHAHETLTLGPADRAPENSEAVGQES